MLYRFPRSPAACHDREAIDLQCGSASVTKYEHAHLYALAVQTEMRCTLVFSLSRTRKQRGARNDLAGAALGAHRIHSARQPVGRGERRSDKGRTRLDLQSGKLEHRRAQWFPRRARRSPQMPGEVDEAGMSIFTDDNAPSVLDLQRLGKMEQSCIIAVLGTRRRWVSSRRSRALLRTLDMA